MLAIEPTPLSSREAVLDVVRSAFSDPTRDGEEEVEMVRKTWARAADRAVFDFVALEEGEVVGHVLAAEGRLAETAAIGIAPLCVQPGHQKSGIGSALMRHVLQSIEQDGWPLALLLGHPDYYGRFGFVSASDYGLTYPLVGPTPAFQVLFFEPYAGRQPADFVYCFE